MDLLYMPVGPVCGQKGGDEQFQKICGRHLLKREREGGREEREGAPRAREMHVIASGSRDGRRRSLSSI